MSAVSNEKRIRDMSAVSNDKGHGPAYKDTKFTMNNYPRYFLETAIHVYNRQ
jgi:hypothetical protein